MIELTFGQEEQLIFTDGSKYKECDKEKIEKLKPLVMLSNYKLDRLFKDIVILVDTREKNWFNIENKFIDNKIQYIKQKLDFGDYSLMIKKSKDNNLENDIYLDDFIVVERKKSLDEISSNLTRGRKRFDNEFLRMKDINCNTKCLLMIEESFRKLNNGSYRSQLKPKQLKGMIYSIKFKYDLDLEFVSPKESADKIYSFLYYGFRNLIKELREN